MKTRNTQSSEAADSNQLNSNDSLTTEGLRLVVSPELIQDSIPTNDSGIIQLYGRRINLDELIDGGNTSVFALMRAWVQDDPHRKTLHPLSHINDDDLAKTSTNSDGMDSTIVELVTSAREQPLQGDNQNDVGSSVLSVIGKDKEKRNCSTFSNSSFIQQAKRRKLQVVERYQHGLDFGNALLKTRGINLAL
ncbi:hypothetical protein ACA910_012866 [Epithemia clementina (nom. ined.)]